MNKKELSAGTTADKCTAVESLTSARLAQNGMLAEVPVRIQRSRQHKQVSPNGLPIVYVGRPGKWGNPFKVVGEVGHWFVLDIDDFPVVTFYEKENAIDCAIEYFKDYIERKIHFKTLNIKELKSKNLSCWCKIGEPCHADVLLELANK